MRLLTLTTTAAAALMMTACASTTTMKKPMEKPMETTSMECMEKSYNVFFDTGSSDFDTAASAELDTIAASAEGCAFYSLELEGHADSVGTSPSNMALSEKRAENVLSALSVRGVTANRISIIPMGEREARVDGDANAALRKVEVRMIP